jgi:hypothetical protein
MYAVPEQTLSSFAQSVAGKVAPLGETAIQVMGSPDMMVKNRSIGVGCGGPQEVMIELGSGVLIMCDGALY